jgi:hypothetical protein
MRILSDKYHKSQDLCINSLFVLRISSHHVKVCHSFQSRYTSQLSKTTDELGHITGCGSLKIFTAIKIEFVSKMIDINDPGDYLNTISDMMKESSSMS